MQVTERAECAMVLSSKQQVRTLKACLPVEVLVRGWVRRHLSDDLSKRVGAYGVKRDLRFAGWLSDRSLKVSEERQ